MADDAVRDEAERLVAAAMTAVSLAARSIPGSGPRAFATGSEECCVCPVCRLIAAMRDPDPDLVDRLASGAGDLAAAVAGVLRNVSSFGGPAGPQAAPHPGPEPDPWQAATTAPPQPPAPAQPPPAQPPPAQPPPAQPPPAQPPSARKVAKKAVAKKAAAKKAAPAARPEGE